MTFPAPNPAAPQGTVTVALDAGDARLVADLLHEQARDTDTTDPHGRMLAAAMQRVAERLHDTGWNAR